MRLLLSASDPQALALAAQRLRAGGLVGMPTETVYGLAADALSARAVAGIFAAKGRPSDHPLIVHISEPAAPSAQTWADAVSPLVRELPDAALALMQAFWPGPLTLILPRRDDVATEAAGGQDSVGLRCPAHPAAQALLQAARAEGVLGLAAPSANRFGRVSPTTAAHVLSEFADMGDGELLVLDGGACAVGIESTIVDLSRGVPVLLRPGQITPERLQAVCGQSVRARDAQAPRASGTLESHYAPTARVRLLDAEALAQALPSAQPGAVAVYARTTLPSPAGVLWRAMPTDPDAVAHELFAVLRDLDASGLREMWVEAPPAGSAWDGVRDRLTRAAA